MDTETLCLKGRCLARILKSTIIFSQNVNEFQAKDRAVTIKLLLVKKGIGNTVEGITWFSGQGWCQLLKTLQTSRDMSMEASTPTLSSPQQCPSPSSIPSLGPTPGPSEDNSRSLSMSAQAPGFLRHTLPIVCFCSRVHLGIGQERWSLSC